jgi:hypothetical protein
VRTKPEAPVLSHKWLFVACTHDLEIEDVEIQGVESCKHLQIISHEGKHFEYQFVEQTNQQILQ